jgi:hypothetical protein
VDGIAANSRGEFVDAYQSIPMNDNFDPKYMLLVA